MNQRIKEILKNTVLTIGILSAVTGLSLLFDLYDDLQHSDAYVSMLFILAVFIISRVTEGYFFGLAASVYGVLTVNYFFTFPYFAFNFSLPGYPITMVALFSVSILTSALTTRMKRQEKMRADAEKEKMRSDLLRAISHDFRTPLTSIMGANAALHQGDGTMTPAQKNELHQSIEDEAQWLRRIVENLLSVTRIGEGGAKIIKTPEAVEEVVAAAVEKFHSRGSLLPVRVSVPQEVLLCPMDALLMEQALLNLLQNAAQHAKDATHVNIIVTREQKNVLFCVIDDGCGMRQNLLGKFRKGNIVSRSPLGDSSRSSGIGLSVCHAIAVAHGGSIQFGNNATGGFRVSISLPLEG